MKTGFYLCSILIAGVARTVFGQVAADATNTVALTPPFIDSLAEEARTNHPALRAADARSDAAVWNAAGVRAWEDPTAKFGVMGADRSKRADDGDLLYGIEQKLPLFGKPQAVRAVAQAEAMTQRHSAAFRALELRSSLTKQLVKVALAERTLELGRVDLASLDTLVTTTEDKYRNGLATQVEVLQSQNERARRANLLRTDEALINADRASLNRFLNRDITASWPRLLLPPLVSSLPPTELMIEHATTMAPQLDIMRASLRQAESVERLARKQRLPDVSLGVEGRQFADNGEFREGTVLLGLSLPWGNRSRYAADIKREQRKAEAAQLDIADMQLTLRDEVTRHAIQIENAEREVMLYRNDIIPRTEQALSGAHVNWLNNRGTLRDVLEARRMLLDAQMMEARALADQHTMLADLLLHCGLGDLRELAMKYP
ncbi:MAG TPA: TolC family protein, partial [Candidatus Limnocylindria bacterium]|nr:TolC family protein [Candidatus Limnocylindria bacterium]